MLKYELYMKSMLVCIYKKKSACHMPYILFKIQIGFYWIWSQYPEYCRSRLITIILYLFVCLFHIIILNNFQIEIVWIWLILSLSVCRDECKRKDKILQNWDYANVRWIQIRVLIDRRSADKGYADSATQDTGCSSSALLLALRSDQIK